MDRRDLLAGLLGAATLSGLMVLTARAASPTPTPRKHLLCRHFTVDLGGDNGGQFETSDQTEEIGQWVAMHESVGWRVLSSDFEVGQKATGVMVGWTEICLERDH
jgi:hypothetical protein